MAKEATLGVRLNNPGNIEWGSPWQGLVPRAQSRYYGNGNAQQMRFCEFTEAAFGIRAIAVTLTTYFDKRKANDGSKIDTIQEVVERWAPAFENNVKAYANHVQKVMCEEVGVCVAATSILDFHDYETMRGLVVGIIAHENKGYRYPDKVVEEGLRRAGFTKPVTASPVPANTATVAGAATPVAGGAVILAPLVEPAIKAITDQQENLTSGQWVRVAIGVLLVAGAIAVVWNQMQKRKAGAA